MTVSSDDHYSLVPFPDSGDSSQSFAIPIRIPRDTQYGLLSFIGIAGALQTDFLDITWQPALDKLGRGGTAEILQSLVDTGTSFAFKRFVVAKWAGNSLTESQIFKMAMAEVLVLGHNLLRLHPNIVNFHGICWEFDSRSQKAYPILVFEKAHLGNLQIFMETQDGKGINLEQKMSLCADVAEGTLALHRYGIAHGDIKPANILVFKHEKGYFAKLADFGHSVAFSSDENVLSLGGSRYWVAPEWHRYRCMNLRIAMKMDAFSFGATSMWLLLYHYRGNTDRSFYKDIELETPISTFAHKLVATIPDATTQQKSTLHKLFDSTLRDEAERISSFESLIHQLAPSKDRPFELPEAVGLSVRYVSNEFHLTPMLFRQLYLGDFRVRAHIVVHLEKNVGKSSDAAAELALCYETGFGVARDVKKSQALVGLNTPQRMELEERISRIKEDVARKYQMYANVHLQNNGCLSPIQLAEYYDERLLSREAIRIYKREISNTEASLGADHHVALALNGELVSLLMINEEWKEAEETVNKLMKMNMRKNKPGYQDDLVITMRLATIYRHTERLDKAEAMQLAVLEQRKQTNGLMHLHTLRSMDELTAIYRGQEKWRDAEDLLLRIMEFKNKLIGPEHQSTLRTMHIQGEVFASQQRWNEAVQQFRLVVDMAARVVTPEDLLSRESVRSLAVMLCKQDRWEEAEEWYMRFVDILKKLYGSEDPRTLDAMEFLVTIHIHSKRWEAADAVAMHVYKSRLRIQSQKDQKTLNILLRLGTIYTAQKRNKEAICMYTKFLDSRATGLGPEDMVVWKVKARLGRLYLKGQTRLEEAEKLTMEALDSFKQTFGPDHAELLFCMRNLARIYRCQGRTGEMEQMGRQIKDALQA